MFNDGIDLQDRNVYSFLMIGQSNMAGRGEFNDVPEIDNDNCFMLRMGRWQKMREPINTDRPIFQGLFHTGRSLGASFADEFAKKYNKKIGLIPCADGGTAIREWMPGELLFDHAVAMTKLAMRSSIFSGILWHQGEADSSNEEKATAHKGKFITMISSLRKELGAEKIPVIIGELSENIDAKYNLSDGVKIINKQYREIEKEIPNCKVVSAKELLLKEDGIHFNSVALREFGKRYFEVYDKIKNL